MFQHAPFTPSSLHAQGWLRSRPSHESDILWNLFDKTFESVLTYVCVNLDAKMEVLECNFIKQVKCAMQCTYTYILYIRTTVYLPTVAAKHIRAFPYLHVHCT